MVKNNKAGLIVMIWVGIVLVSAMAGCGVKTSLVPPKSVPPAAITDLRVTVDQGQAVLRWSIPKGKAAGSAGLAGFLVYQAVTPASDPDCDGCPLLYRRIADVAAEPLMVRDAEHKEATFQQDLEPGFRYAFKIVAYSKTGHRGPDSNTIKTK